MANKKRRHDEQIHRYDAQIRRHDAKKRPVEILRFVSTEFPLTLKVEASRKKGGPTRSRRSSAGRRCRPCLPTAGGFSCRSCFRSSM